MSVGAYRTFSVATPLSTHTRVASCLEVECLAHENGWMTTVDERTELGRGQADYIRHAMTPRRYYTESREGDLTVFTFPAGQKCFAEHRIDLDRPAFFRARPGDHRIRPAQHEIYQYANGDDFVDDFANNQQALAERINRG
jgi:hypothetical protein